MDPEHRDAPLPILTTYEDALNTNYRNSDFMLQNAAYLRLKNIQLAYDLPKGFTDKLHIRSARVFVNGQNLLTFSPMNKYGYDPEKTLSNNDYFDYPSFKMYTGGIQIQF